MTNSTRCTLLAKQACTTLSHVVQKITPPSANNFLKLFFALFAMLTLGITNAWAETVTLNNLGANLSTTSNTTVATTTVGDYTLNYLQGKKQGNAILLAKGTNGGTSFISNKTPIPGAIKSVTVHINSGAAAKTTYHCAFSTTECTAKYSTGSTAVNITGGNSNKYTCSVENASYFCVSLGNNNNGQVLKLEIEYTPVSAGGSDPTITADPTTIDFGTVYQGADVESKTVAVNFENLTGNVTYSGLSTPFTATGTVSNDGDKITISAVASTIGEHSQTLTIQSAADSKTAEVTVKMNVVEKPAPTGTFTLHTGALVEGDYVIVDGTNAMNNTVTSDRLQYNAVTISNNEIVDPLATTIWHIAPNGEYWTIYSAHAEKYAASTNAKNQATLAASVSDNTKWTVTMSGNTFDFENLARSNGSDSGNKYLRKNGSYGFACYASGTGAKLSLYRKAGEKYDVNIASTTNGTVTADPTSAEAGTTITLTVTPDGGYVLDALTVTDASSNPVTVTENKFTMPASDVKVTATFKENEKPAATLTLSKNGETEDITGYKQGDKVTLPSITSGCVKEFVGWSANPTCNVAPEYAAGDSYTLAATAQTLYAVYATAGAGETLTITPSAVSGSEDPYTFTINATGYSLTAKKNSGSTAPTYTSNEVRVYAKGTVTLTAPKAMGTIVLNISTNGKKRLAPITASVGTIATQASGDATVTWTGDATEVTFTVGDIAEFGSENTKAGQLCFGTMTVTTAGSYSAYSTTCEAAPIATVDPTSVTATVAGGNGKVEVTYENVNTEKVSVALFNDAACTETFSADWLTACVDADKDITYTVAENTTYTERKAYIQLTAPETTGAVDPAVVVIPVTQAGKDKVFASLEELVAANLTAGDEVTVTLKNDVIKDFYINSSKRCGVVFDVQKDGKDIKIYFNNQTTIVDWAVGGKLSGTLTNVKWTTYSSAWQLAPDYNTWAWANLTYTEPKAVSTVVVSGAPTKTTYVDGEAFDPAGLTVTVNYNDATSEENPTGVTFNVTPATLTKGQTSVNVTATYNSISSAAYEVTGLTVNDIPTKTIAEFIAARGTRCYLEGIVSGLAEGNSMKYGNFDLTDASGTIYVYGCLNASGEKEKFTELGVKNGDKIKVIADQFKVYSGKNQATDVQYVSHKSAATITIADITMEVGETKTIAATVVPAEAKVTYTIKENAANAISLSGNTITALAEGTATIYANIAETNEYLAATAEFTVTVTSAEQGGEDDNIKTATLTFDDTSKRTTFTTSQQVWQENGITLTNDKSESTSNVADYYNPARFYKNSRITIEHTSKKITKIVFDCNKDTYASDLNAAIKNAGAISNDKVTYTLPEAKESFAILLTVGQVQLDAITVYYYSDGSETPTPNPDPIPGYNPVANPTTLSSIFSVSADKKVQFSTGNLQYEVGTNTWSFASKQYEVIGGAPYDPANPTNTNFGMNVPGYTGKLDLFAWSSDGKYGVNPSNTDADYGTKATDFVDWGTLAGEGWFTLTKEEMNYILNRTKNGKKLWALATIDKLPGLILLPDNWNTNITLTYGYIPTQFVYNENLFTAAEWQVLEIAGAVFLPAAGSRTGGYGNKDNAGFKESYDANGDYFHVDNVGIYGYYWLNTQDPRTNFKHCASYLILPGWDEGPTVDEEGLDDLSTHPQVWSREKRRGNSVRLVKTVEEEEPTTTVSGRWELVTDASTLAIGDKVVIAAAKSNVALSTTQKDNNRGQAAITKNNDNTISFSTDDVQVLTLETGTVDNTFAFYTGNGYLYAASSSSNHLKTQNINNNNSSWKITITDGTASIVAQGTYTRNTMQYNQPSSLFACYGSASQNAICLYRKTNVKVNNNQNTDDIQNFSDITVGNNSELEVTKPLIVENLYIQTTMGAATSAQISNATNTNLLINGDVFIDITLGKNGDPNQWHAFTVPFPIDAMNGVYDIDDNKLTNEVDYAIMDYHGDLRANGQYGWKKYRGILVPGTFYLMTVDGARSTYRFKKVEDAAIVAPATKAITAHTGSGDATKDKGWNGVGNPTLMHGKVGYKALILNPESYTYEPILENTAYFTVGTPFFIQAKTDGTMTMVAETSASLAPARRAAAAVENIKVMLGNSDYTDRLYVSASEDATNEYEIGKDLGKMAMTSTPSVVQISALAYDTRLCMIDAPMANNEALVALNLYAPANGEYTLSIEAQDNEKVYLLHEGTFVWDLSMSEYPITLNKGDNAGYSILVHRADAPTSVETIDGTNNQTEKLIHNGNLYILHNGKVFDAVGTMLK